MGGTERYFSVRKSVENSHFSVPSQLKIALQGAGFCQKSQKVTEKHQKGTKRWPFWAEPDTFWRFQWVNPHLSGEPQITVSWDPEQSNLFKGLKHQKWNRSMLFSMLFHDFSINRNPAVNVPWIPESARNVLKDVNNHWKVTKITLFSPFSRFQPCPRQDETSRKQQKRHCFPLFSC